MFARKPSHIPGLSSFERVDLAGFISWLSTIAHLVEAGFVRAFIEEMKANGFVADALDRCGQKAPFAPKAN